MNTVSKPASPAVQQIIPLSVPEISGNEWKYIKECLDTGWVSSVGPFVERFEGAVAEFVGTKFAVATVNGTAAIHIALKIAGVEAGDEVLISAITFIAPANAIRYLGAYPVFIDAEPKYWQMDPEKVADFLKNSCQVRDGALYNSTTGRRVKAIVPVHVLGHPVDLDPILEIARKFSLAVVEDATESLGAKYHGRMVGNLGQIACFSFNGNKIITTGGGGMIVTNNEAWARHAKYLTTQAKDDPLEYIHHEVGYNYRLTNLLAAMGCAQMELLPSFIDRKREIASRYAKQLDEIPGITTMPEAPWAFSTHWLYTVLIDAQVFGMDSRALLRFLAKESVQSRPLWQPLHRSQALKDCGKFICPNADRLNRDAISLPCSAGLSNEDLQVVIEAVKCAFSSRH
jgi:perosamine synthetase